MAKQAIGSFKSTVTACLLGASAEDGPIDANYVQCATEYVAYMHQRFVQKRQHHDKMMSPYELNVGVKPRLDRAVPFGTPGYAFVHPEVRKARGWSKSVRSEPVLMLGYQPMYPRTYKCLTERGSIIHVDKVRWCPQEPLGVFLKWRKNLSTGGGHHLALDPFDKGVDGAPDTAESDKCQAGLDEAGTEDQTRPPADGAGEKGALAPSAEESAKGNEALTGKATATIGKASKKSKVNLKGDRPAEPEFLRIGKDDLKSSGVQYIRDRTRALDGQCVADAIERHFSDGKGGTKRYNWESTGGQHCRYLTGRSTESMHA